jgi:hypothetical protein
MAIPTPADAYAELEVRVTALRGHFADQHVAATAMSDEIAMDLDAYVIMSHSAFEQFFESLSGWLLGQTVDNWKTSGKVSHAVAALALRYASSATSKIDWDSDDRHFDRTKQYLDDVARKAHSGVIDRNHGADLKYIRRLLCPLGIDVPADAKLRAALDQFAKARGEPAHKVKVGASTHKAAKDLVDVVGDCLELARSLRDRVAAGA